MTHKGYFKYIQDHQSAVRCVWFNQLRKYVNEWKGSEVVECVDNLIRNHDNSKYELEEYAPYDNYFYRHEGDEEEITRRFEQAWLHHQNVNKHHWQYWVLISDSDDDKVKPLDMPLEYICEMVCDWQSFSVNDPDSTAKNWYNKNKDNMLLTDYTRSVVEELIRILENEPEAN